MNAHVKLSVKGQVVIPKDVRDLLKWESGLDLEVIQQGNGVTLRPSRAKRVTITHAEFLQQVPPHTGPFIHESEWQKLMEDDLAKRWKAEGC